MLQYEKRTRQPGSTDKEGFEKEESVHHHWGGVLKEWHDGWKHWQPCIIADACRILTSMYNLHPLAESNARCSWTIPPVFHVCL
jgi:hypothetical protein